MWSVSLSLITIPRLMFGDDDDDDDLKLLI